MWDFDTLWQSRLDEWEGLGRRRRLRPVRPADAGGIEIGGRVVADFSSNDYLGLARHPALIERAADFARRYGAGAGASRLVTGNIEPFALVEDKLAAAKQAPAALVLASGFQANASVLPALCEAGPGEAVILADRLIHASLIQGALAARVRLVRFRHNDLDHLDSLLARHAGPGTRLFVVTETVFSMDGDRADLGALLPLVRRYGAFLYLDEAHATGILGESGFGLAAGLAGPDCLVMGTFSKAMGGFGAYVACSVPLREYLVNRCPGLVFATALPPAVLGAMDAALDLVPALGAERRRVAALAEGFRAAMAGAGLDTGASSTQIVPVMLGDDKRAVSVSAALEAAGYLAVAIRPPTVPEGSARIRFAFSARHDEALVGDLANALKSLLEPA